jgi:hypothetical protein
MIDLRDVTPEKLLEMDKTDPAQRMKYLRVMTALKVGFGLERAMHAYDIDIPMEKVDLVWRSICESVLELPEWMILDYAKKLRKNWGCDSCHIQPCDPKACKAADSLGEDLLGKIQEDTSTVH